MEILVGDEHINCTPVIPYDERVCDMLDAWATEIRGDREAKAYPDVLTFGFFIRKGSISKKKKDFLRSCEGVPEAVSVNEGKQEKHVSERRLGRGLAFHIAPSNVPVNCMYTLVFGLLSGCANIVRVPSKEFPQVDILCRTLSSVLKKHKFAELADRIQVLRYDRDEKNASGVGMTEFFSSICDVRIIWGGDETVADIRKNPLSPRAKEITFADRYSVGIMDLQAVRETTDKELASLARDFYNDTYLMDQNACSCPHLILWTMKGFMEKCIQERVAADGLADIPDSPVEIKEMLEPGMKETQDRFWQAVVREASERYELADIKVSEKYADLCEKASDADSFVKNVKKYADNLLYVCDIDEVGRETSEACRGKYGLFFQMEGMHYDVLKPVLDDPKVQTVAVYGVDTSEVADWVVDNGITGVDRVVPFGKTLDIDVVWDGYDLVSEMSRIVAG